MCIFIKKNGKRVAALALVPFLAINIYVGSRIIKGSNVTKVDNDKKSSTVEMIDKQDFRSLPLSGEGKSVEQEVVKTTEEKNVFEKLQQIYLNSNRDINEILENEERTSEIYASALYSKLKNAGLSDEIIRKEIDNILTFSLTFTDTTEEEWISLFGNLLSTISEYDNVMDYYYPLAIYIHKNECNLEHSECEYDSTRVTCVTLEEMAQKAFSEIPYADYVIEMILASNDEKVISQYNRIINAGVNFDDALVELNSIYELSQVPMCIDEDAWNELFKNLLTTVGEYDNVFEVYGDLAYYVHLLGCDFDHYTDEYGVNVCEGMKLEYTYGN